MMEMSTLTALASPVSEIQTHPLLVRVIGSLSPSTLVEIEECLKAAMALS